MPGRFFNSLGGELGRLVDQHKKITKSKENLLVGVQLSDAKGKGKPAGKGRSMHANSNAEELSIGQQLCRLLSSALYMRLVFALSGLYFIVTELILGNHLHGRKVGATIDRKNWFCIDTITGPLIGVFLGGWLIDKLGGYKDDRTIWCSCIKSMFVFRCRRCAFRMYLRIYTELLDCFNKHMVSSIFGGAILPALTGIIINAVGEECKTWHHRFRCLCIIS